MKQALLSSNGAITRWACEAGFQIATGSPGDSEIPCALVAQYGDESYAEWSTQEKATRDTVPSAAYSVRRPNRST